MIILSTENDVSERADSSQQTGYAKYNYDANV